MALAGVAFPCLTSVAVTLEGVWAPPPRRDWQGAALASEPLVGVAFLSCGDMVEWCKSERGSADNPKVRFALFPYAADGRDVQVNFSVGRGVVRRQSVLGSCEATPAIPDRRELRAGMIERFAEVAGAPRVELSFLLIARRDVRSARNGLWRVREVLAKSIPEPFRRVLTYGRTGRFQSGG